MAPDTGVGCLRLPGGTEGALTPWVVNKPYARGSGDSSHQRRLRGKGGGQLSNEGPCPQDPTGGAKDLSR